MIEIHVYGLLRKRFDPEASMAGNMIINVDAIEGESFSDFLFRIKIDKNDCGDCFIDGTVAADETPVPNGSRVALFPRTHWLLCGGQHLKGHGFITKKVDRSNLPSYFDEQA
ncbi:MAG: hypothetical protein ACFFD4_31815 [Candidatus Odinarchaeota archaeon]